LFEPLDFKFQDIILFIYSFITRLYNNLLNILLVEALVVSGVLKDFGVLAQRASDALQNLYESFARHHTSLEEHQLSPQD
jgi:hypothetical protein